MPHRHLYTTEKTCIHCCNYVVLGRRLLASVECALKMLHSTVPLVGRGLAKYSRESRSHDNN